MKKQKELTGKAKFQDLFKKYENTLDNSIQVNIRCSPEQKELLVYLARRYAKGNLSRWLIMAGANYRPYELDF